VFLLLYSSNNAKAQVKYPGQTISSAANGAVLSSPSILELPDGNFLVSHDKLGTIKETDILYSVNGGESWQLKTTISGIKGGTLFLHQNTLYIIGTTEDFGNIIIRKSEDFGNSWSTPQDVDDGKLFVGQYKTKPVPIAIHNGQIWRSFDTVDGGVVVISAAVNANLLQASSWQKSDEIFFNAAWLNADSPQWTNGNILVNKDGNLVNIAPVSSVQGVNNDLEFVGGALGIPRYELSALISVSSNSSALHFNPCTDFVHLPGSGSKYTIKYDPITDKYWSIVNKISQIYSETNPHYSPIHQKNVLMLVSSPDLIHWTENSIIVSWNIGEKLNIGDKIGFHDIDWQFNGDDIVAVSSTAWYSSNYKNANHITFHRVSDFRTKQMYPMPEDLAVANDGEDTNLLSEVLLGWYMNSPNTNGNEADISARLVNGNIAPSKLTRGNGLSPANFTRSFFSKFNYIGSPINSKEYAIENKAYFEFSIKPKANAMVALDTLKFKLRSGSNGPYYYRWLYSTDNWITSKELGTADESINYLAALPDGSMQVPIVLANEYGLRNVAGGTTILFRLYVWGATNATTSTIAIGRSDANAEASVVLSVIGRTLTTLPVKLISFKGERTLTGVKLTWETASENNSSHFNIWHSLNGKQFGQIATVASKGNSTSRVVYHYTDRNASSGYNYYKLVQEDINSSAIEYQPIVIKASLNSSFLTMAQSLDTNGEMLLSINSSNQENGVVTVSDIMGRVLIRQNILLEKGQTQLKLQGNLLPGNMYLLSYKSALRQETLKFIGR